MIQSRATFIPLFNYINISSNPQSHIKWLEDYFALGFEKIVLHNVNKNQKNFIHAFGKTVLKHVEIT